MAAPRRSSPQQGARGGNAHQSRNQPRNQSSGTDVIQLAVKGWAAPPSKFSGNPESGLHAIVTFLEKKSQRTIHSHKMVGNSNILLIDINAADSQRFYHLDGFTFSGAPLTIEESRGRPTHQTQNQDQPRSQPRNRASPDGPGQRNQHTQNVPTGPRLGRHTVNGTSTGTNNNNNNNYNNQHTNGRNGNGRNGHNGQNGQNGHNGQNPFSNTNNNTYNQNTQNGFGQTRHTNQTQPQQQQRRPSSEKNQLEDLMARIIRKRYNPEARFLNFFELAGDADIAGTPLVQSTAAKVWSAFFTVCSNHVFETAAKRREMVDSISLANNGLADVKDVIAMSATFPQLKNLDLSNNNISTAGDLRFWRNSLRSIEHLILANNPIMNNPAEVQKLLRWWGRSLKLFNSEPVSQFRQSPSRRANNRTWNASPDGSMRLDDDSDMPVDTTPPQTPPLPFGGITSHPEVDVTTFGQPQLGKSEDQMMKERMGLQFSVETHLKMKYVEECLLANNFDYDKAMAHLRAMWERGEVPADAFL